MTSSIPGLHHLKGFFPKQCTATATELGISPCCLVSGKQFSMDDTDTMKSNDVPCQRCMVDEIDAKYIDEDGNIVSKFDHHDIKGKSMARRVQHYGCRYDYTSKILAKDQCFSFNSLDLLQDLSVIFSNIFGDKLPPNQCIINEYLKKQHINAHTDSLKFGPVIVTVSLLGDTHYVMDLSSDLPPIKFSVEPGDVIILSGDARYKWRHGTTGNLDKDYRRISVTLRHVDPKETVV
jgi:alkylated DNA repair dioxygenase AlkB